VQERATVGDVNRVDSHRCDRYYYQV
jgi:hypothetical protein